MTTPAGAKAGGQGRQLALKLRAYLRPKAVAVLLDASLSGACAARVAVYQSFLLAAMKAHVFAVAAGIRSEGVVGGAVASAIAYMARQFCAPPLCCRALVETIGHPTTSASAAFLCEQGGDIGG